MMSIGLKEVAKRRNVAQALYEAAEAFRLDDDRRARPFDVRFRIGGDRTDSRTFRRLDSPLRRYSATAVGHAAGRTGAKYS
jgi:hypothetical protein